MIATALLMLSLGGAPDVNLDGVVFQLGGRSYADVAQQAQAKFPAAVISRAVDHEVLALIEQREDPAAVAKAATALAYLRGMVRILPGPHATREVLAFAKGIDPGAYASSPARPGVELNE